ncbi:MAG TPA: hypothetical protein VM051_01830 [Usitatibacter sp.]|nr:hypothetical protein [Usitatibacter sp.]
MIMNRKQLMATALLAVLIVASVMSMPRASMEAPPQKGPIRASGMIATAPAAGSELAPEQVKDLTYN